MANRIVLAFDPTYGFQETIASGDNIDMQSAGKIINLAAATTGGDAVSYGQSGASLAGLTLTAALVMGGFAITSVLDPVNPQDAATKNYVDGKVNGLSWKSPVLLMTTGNVALTGEQTIDGVLTSASRVAVFSQTTGTQNGIYTTAAGAWTRTADFASGAHEADTAFFVEEGTANADTAWTVTQDPPNDVVNTNTLTVVKFSSSVYTAGNGITLTGNSFSVKAGDGIETTSNSNSTNVRLDASAPGLLFTGSAGSGALQVKVLSTGGLEVLSTGVDIKVDSTTSGNPTVATGTNGLRVIGLPSLFNINSVATSANVTAANLGTLTAGPVAAGNADALHEHMQLRGQFVTVGALAKADPVFWSSTNNQVDKALGNTDASSYAVGVAMAAALASASADIVFKGIAAGILTGATAGQIYWLSPAGGMQTTVPGSGRIMTMGMAKNATDFFVDVRDYGKKF